MTGHIGIGVGLGFGKKAKTTTSNFYPSIALANSSSATYTAATGRLDITANPANVILTSSSGPGPIGTPKQASISISLNPEDGSLVSGVSGNDLTITGTISSGGYTSPLLTGEVIAFSRVDNPGTVLDNYTIRFRVTGGSLAAHPGYADQDAYMSATIKGGADPVNWGGNWSTTLAVAGNIYPVAQL